MCVTNICAEREIQQFFFDSGCHFVLIQHFFEYDYTLQEQSASSDQPGAVKSAQFEKNRVALCAAAALGALCQSSAAGKDQQLVRNEAACDTMNRLITHYITRFIYGRNYARALKAFTTTTCNPHTIWNNKTRAQLQQLSRDQVHSIKTNGGRYDKTLVSTFTYAEHAQELIVGGIFIKLYNKDPAFEIEDAEALMNSLLMFLFTESKNHKPRNSVADALQKLDEDKTAVVSNNNSNNAAPTTTTDLISFDDPALGNKNGQPTGQMLHHKVNIQTSAIQADDQTQNSDDDE